MLRRYGEQALTEDVRALLKDWGAHIQSCSAIFLSCPKTMRSVIFEDGGKEVPIRRSDPRVRLVPFMVSAASQPTCLYRCNHTDIDQIDYRELIQPKSGQSPALASHCEPPLLLLPSPHCSSSAR